MSATGSEIRPRVDLRLVPAAMLSWIAAAAAVYLPSVWTLVLAAVLGLAAAVLLGGRLRRRAPCRETHGGSCRQGCSAGCNQQGRPARSVFATVTFACLLGAGVAIHGALAASQRSEGPFAEAAAAKDRVLVHVLVVGEPHGLAGPGEKPGSRRWAVSARLVEAFLGGKRIRAAADITIIGGEEWGTARSGQLLRTTGRLKVAEAGRNEAAVLSASSKGTLLQPADFSVAAASRMRADFRAAAAWLPPDAAGLFPGMVTGDTSALDPSLEQDMQNVGLTHLTAVSGANCSLVLGGFLLLARTMRLPRPAAALLALLGLGAFVLLVGTEASVLRAAVMGAVGLAAVAGGRQGRSLSFLCLAVIALLLFDPRLGTDIGFLLSVLATLGIVLLAARVASWLQVLFPPWLAVSLAVPLSAQLLCGPVVVLLQPQFTSYALPANVLAAPLVAPVTILGTIAVPLLPVAPWLAAMPIALGGISAAGVAATARFFAALPGAVLPWPEGPWGLATMTLLSVLTLLCVWGVVHLHEMEDAVHGAHRRLTRLLAACGRRHRPGVQIPGNPGRSGRGPRHGRLEVSNKPSGRNRLWLRRTPGLKVPRRKTSAGGTLRRPP